LDFKSLFKSLKFFCWLSFKKIRVDIVFVYLSHFNRAKGRNTYLHHLIQEAKETNKSYLVFEDSDLAGAYKKQPRSRSAIPFDFITLVYISLSKLGLSEQTIFLIIKKIFLRNLRFKTIINMAGYTNKLFLSQYQGCEMYEVQHGMLFNGREWWMSDLWNNYPNCGVLLFGNGYKNMITTQSSIYDPKEDNKARVLGFENTLSVRPSFTSNIIVLTEQITIDNKDNEIKDYIDHLDLIFSNLNNLNLKLITKSHPRSPKNKVNILSNLILERTDSIKKYSEIFLHVTFNSSSVFEYGLCGIPTILLGGLSRRDPTFFVNEYNFPFPNLIINNSRDLEYAISFLKNEKNYLETSKAIKDWSKEFYSSLQTNML